MAICEENEIVIMKDDIYNICENDDGCDFVEKEVHENVQVTVCECEHCGKVDVSWSRN